MTLSIVATRVAAASRVMGVGEATAATAAFREGSDVKKAFLAAAGRAHCTSGERKRKSAAGGFERKVARLR